ncbi:anti-sigma factor [Rhizobium lemnae]|uniref:Anti-sigma factor domain-containing protein n=1 Tax=Rhizobium lemnae TaxID=1214924 RepID=A0ABV8EAV4_9HYPH|nr:anti-sigma factor [Rhizobium lemnae]MCJ8506348.1 anti-sigma factor [Rhizobium lemnae]
MIDLTKPDAVADDYVLGLLEPADMKTVEAELERNVALRRAVAQSRERFLPLDMTAEPAEVSHDLWTRIERDLQQRVPSEQTTEVEPDIANDNRSIQNEGFWRVTSFAGLAASLVLAVALGWNLTRTAEPLVVAVLVNETGEVQAVVEDFGTERAVVRLLADVSVPGDRTMQVWTLPSKETGPVSMGLLPQARSARLVPPSLPAPKDAQLYEITLEPAGGSPTGRPTGPILAKGFAKVTR